ncbi:MAG TPA: TraR/DksA C4-type zinc finger protein [Anaerolineae bacterium]|nr:TraR/DksA C4-type zinc finger protein [Anaerolineae bacterium]
MPVPYERLKKALLVEQARLDEVLAGLTEVAVQDNLGYGNHQADDGTAAFDQAKDLAMRINAEGLLKQVNDALRRFENGTYGLCVECNQPIDPARLKAIPYAELCMDCQRKRER